MLLELQMNVKFVLEQANADLINESMKVGTWDETT